MSAGTVDQPDTPAPVPSALESPIRRRSVLGGLAAAGALAVVGGSRLVSALTPIVSDPQSGILSVIRRPDASPISTPQPAPEPDLTATMKRKTPLAVLGSWIALALAPGHSAGGAESATTTATATGGITGRVQNVATGQYLNNARMAQLHAQQAPDRVRELEAWGSWSGS